MGKYLIIFILIFLAVQSRAEGIRDEIFYLNRENKLSINEENLNKLKQEDSTALIEILAESKEDHPIKTIMGELQVSTAAKNEIILKLAEFADQRARDIIEWYMLNSPDRFNRHIAAVALGSVGDKTSIEKLKTVIKELDPALVVVVVPYSAYDRPFYQGADLIIRLIVPFGAIQGHVPEDSDKIYR